MVVFSSPVFLHFFLPVAVVGYFLCPERVRNAFLILASLIFYAWGEGVYVALLAVSAVGNHLAGLAVERCPINSRRRRVALAVAVGANLSVLLYFKYWGFVVEQWAGVEAAGEGSSGPHLPLGVSFFTFQGIAYLVDVYRGTIAAQRRLDRTALYIALFPQLIAGPIVRYAMVAGALARRRFSVLQAAAGAELFIIGLAKKVLLADPLGRLADVAFASPGGELPAWLAWLGALAYALQIYFDFSGYTDMARGLGKVFGFELPENFRFPYRSTSVREFWRRWHITLSSWFRDYVYIPLGGNRVGRWRRMANLWIVFLLCGLWHGASWNFALWGALHGAWMVSERLWGSAEGGVFKGCLGWGATAAFLLLSWVVFRSPDFATALGYWSSMFGFGGESAMASQAMQGMDGRFWLTLGIGLVAAGNGHGALRRRLPMARLRTFSWALPAARLLAFAALLLLCIIEIAASRYEPFIYFRF